MFEGLLEQVLNSVLGKYIQGLNKQDLKLSVWNGNILLQNVKLRSDIFKQFKLPLELIHGLIGKLKITVPWSSLGSSPVDVVISDIQIVVKPITDQQSWELSDSSLNFELKEAALHAFAYGIYQQLIVSRSNLKIVQQKTQEEIAKEAGMMQGIVTKIIDNLQVQIQNVHIRIENEDMEDKSGTFSLGVTLKSMTFNTTDQNWKKQFVDRTLKENLDLPLFKLLKIEGFAIYYKIEEKIFIKNYQLEEQSSRFQELFHMESLSHGEINIYKQDYLLAPIELEVKMEQFDASQALQQVKSALTLNIQLNSFGISLQKAQYDNLQRLLELTNDYMRFCNTEALRQKKVDLKLMNETLLNEKRCNGIVTKREVKQIFLKIFPQQLDCVIKLTLDEKKKVELRNQLNSDLNKNLCLNAYQSILTAIDVVDLNLWAKLAAEERAEAFKAQRIKQEQAKSQSWFSWGFGYGKTQQTEVVQNVPVQQEISESEQPNKQKELVQSSLLKKMSLKIEEEVSLQQQISLQYANTMKSVPNMRVNFLLKEFYINLKNDSDTGLSIYSNELFVCFNKFDATNKYNPHSMQIDLKLQSFGIVVLKSQKKIPFVQQLNTNCIQQTLTLSLALGNINNQHSDLPQNQINSIDLDVDIQVKPVEIIYQAEPIETLGKFFKVKNMRDHTKIAAQEQFAGLTKSVNNISKSIEADFKNNKISIKVDSPCFILPFNQDSQQSIDEGECWVFTMGDLNFYTSNDSRLTDFRFHEAFQLKVSKVKFEYVNQYSLWKQQQAQITTVLSDFETTVTILRKREIDQMRNQSARDALKKLQTPQTEIRASFDTEILLQLRPEIFIKLCDISSLFVTEALPNQFYIDRMNDRFASSHLSSYSKRENYLIQWVSGTMCLLKPGTIYFYEEGNIFSEFQFSLDGIEKPNCCNLEGQELQLINLHQQQLKLMLPTMKLASRWQSEVMIAAQQIQIMKKNLNLTESIDLYGEINGELEEQNPKESHEIMTTEDNFSNKTNFMFTFTAPSIQLQLLTQTPNKVSKIQDEKWRLLTFMEQLSVKFLTSTFETTTEIKIRSLKVTDNSGDQRFQSIFENQPVDGQEELVTIKLQQVQQLSPQYNNIDQELFVSLGGLVVNWKPICISNLYKFLSTQSKNVKQDKQNKNTSHQKVEQLELDSLITDADKGRSHIQTIETKKQKSCKDKIETLLKVNFNLSYMMIVFIHPQNHTYPIFSLKLEELRMGYSKKCDHNFLDLHIKNFQVHDNQNYPQTLDPLHQYSSFEKVQIKEIMGVKVQGLQNQLENMLDIDIVMFTYPGETGCCPLQPNKEYNMTIDLLLRKLKVVFMNQQTMRMLDYVNNQVLGLIRSNQTGQENVEKEKLPKVEQEHQLQMSDKSKLISIQNFDLEQIKQGPAIKIQMHSPEIVIPNLVTESDYLFMDFGKITVNSKIVNEPGRWINFQQKLIYLTKYIIQNQDMRFDSVTKEGTDTIFNTGSLDVVVSMVNASPFLVELNQEQAKKSNTDMREHVDSSMLVEIGLKVFKMILKQNTLIRIFDILVNNIQFKDQFSQHFKSQLVIQDNSIPVVEKVQIQENLKLKDSTRKSMEIRISGSCFSVEMRDLENVLILEICIAGLEFNQQSYWSGRSVMKVQAGTMFMFHEEIQESQMKQVMMGHLDATSEVFTNKEFYETISEEFLNDDQQQLNSGFVFIQEFTAHGDSDMLMEMKSVKLYVRQEVFIKLSNYLIQGLQRMNASNSSNPEQPKVVKPPSSSKSKIKICFNKTLMILENTQMSKKCIALEVSVDVLLKSIDPKYLKTILRSKQNQQYSLTNVDAKSIAIFLCNVDDVAENGYTLSEKRDVLQPLNFKLNWEINLKNDFPVCMINTSNMQLEMSDAILKVSIDDLYVIKAISDKQNSDLVSLGKVWSENSAKNQPPPIVEIKDDQNKDKNISAMYFNAKKVEILLINEQDGCYIPLFFAAFDTINFTQQGNDSSEGKSGSYLQLQISFDYYNANSSCYEPLIEPFPLMYKTSQTSQDSDTKIQLVQAISLNITVDLATCFAVFNKLWADSIDTASKFKQKQQDLLQKGTSTFMKSKSGQAIRQKSTLNQRKTAIRNEKTLEDQNLNYALKSKISHIPTSKLTIREQNSKLSSPYAIRNLLQQPIKVFSIDKQGNLMFDDAEVIEPGDVKKLVNQMSDLDQINAARKSGFNSGTEMDLFVKLQFAGKDMKTVERLNLNKNNSLTYYNLFEANSGREKIVFESKLEDNRRVLTLEKIQVLSDQRLQPGQSMPFPDHPDSKIKVKIAIRPSKCKKWSQEFKLKEMKQTIKTDENIIWQHNETYSILRKLSTNLPGAYDLVLQPAIIIKSCLPCKIKIDLNGTNKQQSNIPSPIQKIQNQDDQDQQIKICTIELDKQEEKQLQDIKKFTGELNLLIQIGDQFHPTELHLLPDKNKEEDVKILIKDKSERILYIMARIETRKAGLSIIFFCENLLVCRTSQKLSFFYHKRIPDQIPSPVIDEEENQIYIIQSSKGMYSLGEDTGLVFSEKLIVDGANITSNFDLKIEQSKKVYNFGYDCRLWSASETDFISTKIIEITPLFILCNQTKDQIIFNQEQTDGKNFLRIESQERQPYHWSDRDKPQLLKFKPNTDNFYFCFPFSLMDVGIIHVFCQQGDDKFFYRVTKRMVNQTVYIIVEESQYPQYVIKNSVPDLIIKACQADVAGVQSYLVESNNESSFSWTKFDISEPKLQVEFWDEQQQLIPDMGQNQTAAARGLDSMKILKIEIKTLKFSLDELNEERVVNFMNRKQQIYVRTYKDTYYKVIEFSDQPPNQKLKETQNQLESQLIIEEESKEPEKQLYSQKKNLFEGKDKVTITIEIAQINISCIYSGSEVMVVFLHDIQLKQATTDTDQVIEAYLGRFQIDNNQAFDTLFPVMLKPKCLVVDKEHNHRTMQGVDPVFQFYLHKKLEVPNVNYIELFEFLVKELEVKMELDHIFSLMEWIFAVQKQLNTSLTSISPVFKNSNSQVIKPHEETKDQLSNSVIVQQQSIKTWRNQELIKTDESIVYIKSYKGSPLWIELSLFKQTGGTQQEQDKSKKNKRISPGARIMSNIANMGINITSLNNAPIKLEALHIPNIYGNQSDILSRFIAHYFANITSNIFRVLASSDLIGNPGHLVNTLGTSVKKFYYDPRNGVMEGPLQRGLGLIKGTAGFVLITGATTLNSFGKVSSSINKGIVAISFDKDYIHDKEINDIKNKPQTFLTGVGQGSKGLVTSVMSGVSGVITKPISGASKGGISGFFKGAGIGLAGLVTKPISGVVDLISKTTQGLETDVTGEIDCIQNCQRMRDPRAFYKELNIVKIFNPIHAELYHHLRSVLANTSPFYGAFICGAGQTDSNDTKNDQNQQTLLITGDMIYELRSDKSEKWKSTPKEVLDTVRYVPERYTQSKIIFTQFDSHQKNVKKEEIHQFCFTSFEQFQECEDELRELGFSLRFNNEA